MAVTEVTEVIDSEVLFSTILEPTLRMVGCENVYPFPLSPVTTEERLMELLQVSEGDDQDKLEGWFCDRNRLQHPDIGESLEYISVSHITIQGTTWNGDLSTSRNYIHDTVDKVSWTLERNKHFSLGSGTEVREISARFGFEPLGGIYMYRGLLEFQVDLRIRDGIRTL